jgi:cysteine synthase
MTTITIQVPEKVKGKLSAIVKELGGEVISVSSDKETSKKTKLLNEIRQGLKEVKDIQEGKSKSYSMSDLLDAE